MRADDIHLLPSDNHLLPSDIHRIGSSAGRRPRDQPTPPSDCDCDAMPPPTELSNRGRATDATKSTTPIRSLFQSSRLYRFAAAASAKDHPTTVARQDSSVPKSLKVFKGQAKDIVQGIFLFLMLRFLLVAFVCFGLLAALGFIFVLQARSKAALDPSISFWAALW